MVSQKKGVAAWMQSFADIESVKSKIIIYPTDTVYGIGCNAENTALVERIFEIKGRDRKKPLSVIAPAKEWILKHCVISKEALDKYLPGKYTLILKKKDAEFLKHVTAGIPNIGVRIPAHPFSNIVKKAQIPFVTTSANRSGEKSPKSLSEIPDEIRRAVDIIIDGGTLSGTPSTLVDFTRETEAETIIERI